MARWMIVVGFLLLVVAIAAGILTVGGKHVLPGKGRTNTFTRISYEYSISVSDPSAGGTKLEFPPPADQSRIWIDPRDDLKQVHPIRFDRTQIAQESAWMRGEFRVDYDNDAREWEFIATLVHSVDGNNQAFYKTSDGHAYIDETFMLPENWDATLVLEERRVIIGSSPTSTLNYGYDVSLRRVNDPPPAAPTELVRWVDQVGWSDPLPAGAQPPDPARLDNHTDPTREAATLRLLRGAKYNIICEVESHITVGDVMGDGRRAKAFNDAYVNVRLLGRPIP